jgi:hypothetical protein
VRLSFPPNSDVRLLAAAWQSLAAPPSHEGAVTSMTPRSSSVSIAQSPWEVTVTSGLNPLPIPFCSSVRVDVIDSKTRQRPRMRAKACMEMRVADFVAESSGLLAISVLHRTRAAVSVT